ncbi:hypothetical protein [Antrihabitans stalactiti]|uniref:Uncharacterized protein n=1 Tax=Antrihabitans stalactiti TaxID=2584121 RepID=A0A848KJJ0_9NOCA|nr:hypothetical protein [Antrihabitans stalactiti]NMN96400.1 hypothetical protein [Antrihabitans stalactiti]
MGAIALLLVVAIVGGMSFVLWRYGGSVGAQPWNELYRKGAIHAPIETLQDANYGHPIDVVATIRQELALIPRDPVLKWETFMDTAGEGDETQVLFVVRLLNVSTAPAEIVESLSVNLTDNAGERGIRRWDNAYRQYYWRSRAEAVAVVNDTIVSPTVSWARFAVSRHTPPPALDPDYRIL